jgi:hypothetical protein
MIRCSLALIPAFSLFLGCGDAGGSGTEGASSGAQTSSGGETPTSSGGETPTSTGVGESSGGPGDPFMAEPVCSSGKMWTQGNTESPHMHPGMACQACHKEMEPPLVDRLSVVGTVYPTGHEPDDCLGVDGAADMTFVEITTADAKVVKLPVNSSGNFHYDAFEQGGALMFPITAKVVKGDKERVMLTPQASGDCNSCHTQDGAMAAPGRIVEPL